MAAVFTCDICGANMDRLNVYTDKEFNLKKYTYGPGAVYAEPAVLIVELDPIYLCLNCRNKAAIAAQDKIKEMLNG